MSRTFAYCRVSTTEQTTENQIQAILKAGYDVQPNRVISETVSGSVQAMKRPEFSRLMDKMESGDQLVVLKLDRLGRDNIDIQQTITMLNKRGISVQSMDLPQMDLSSSTGQLMLQMFSAFAEFERNRIRERTADGLARAKAEGKRLGRPSGAASTTTIVQGAKRDGLSQSQAAAKLGLSIATVKRHWNKSAQ